MSAASSPSAAAAAAVAVAASASPRAPVAAFAWPLFTSTARGAPSASRARESRTGAALTRFVVKTPAAVVPGSPTQQRRGRAGRSA